MTHVLERPYAVDLEIRGDGRTIAGIVVPFGKAALVRDPGRPQQYTESFARGAFTRTLTERGPERVKLLVQHDQNRLPIGRATLLREDTPGLYGEFRVSKTPDGDMVLELVRDGALDAFSVGFRPVLAGDRWNPTKTRVDRTEVKLAEVSVVPFGAYEDARIMAVRSEDNPTINIGAARRRLTLMENL